MHILQLKILELSKIKNIGILSLRQIGEEVGDPQPQKIKHHLEQLFKKGFLKKEKSLIKSVELETSDFFYSIKILGSANCGRATTFADENIEGYLTLSKSMLRNVDSQYFAVKAVGVSMNKSIINGKNIEDGDYLIIDPHPYNMNYYNNKYVLSIINGMANIKKFVIEQHYSRIALISESTEPFPPIYIHQSDLDSYRINGVVTEVIKS